MSGVTAIVIAHGRSEVMFCDYVSRQTKVPMYVHSRNDGKDSIQINGIRDELLSYPFDSYASLRNAYPGLEYVPQISRRSFSEDRSEMPRLTIHTILDTDDSPLHVKSYISGDLFRGCPMERHVTSVYNIRNLDEVFQRYGVDIDANNKARSYSALLRSLDLRRFYAFLKSDAGTNLDTFIESCLSKSPRKRQWYDEAISAS